MKQIIIEMGWHKLTQILTNLLHSSMQLPSPQSCWKSGHWKGSDWYMISLYPDWFEINLKSLRLRFESTLQSRSSSPSWQSILPSHLKHEDGTAVKIRQIISQQFLWDENRPKSHHLTPKRRVVKTCRPRHQQGEEGDEDAEPAGLVKTTRSSARTRKLVGIASWRPASLSHKLTWWW